MSTSNDLQNISTTSPTVGYTCTREQGVGSMQLQLERERREFVRVRAEVSVRYKFLSETGAGPEFDAVYEGRTCNLSGTGLLLLGAVPVLSWVPDLLMQKIVVGLNLMLPASSLPLKILGRVAWIETIDEKSKRCNMGVYFREITTQDKDAIFQYIIKSQMPG